MPQAFPALHNLFTKTPVKFRQEAWDRLVWLHPYDKREAPLLHEYYYDQTNNLSVAPLGKFPERSRSLKEELFALPYDSNFGE